MLVADVHAAGAAVVLDRLEDLLPKPLVDDGRVFAGEQLPSLCLTLPT